MKPDKVRIYFLFAFVAATAVLSLYILQPFIILLVLALVGAVVLYPLFSYIQRRFRTSETVAATVTLLITLLCLAVVLYLFGNTISAEGAALYLSSQDGSLAQYIGQSFGTIQATLSYYVPSLQTISGADVVAQVEKYAQALVQWFVANSFATFSGAGTFLIDMFIFFMALFYLLKEGTTLKKKVFTASPLTNDENETISLRMIQAVRSIVQGMLFKALIQGVLAAIGFAVFGVPSSLLWAVAVAFASLVPAIGTALVYVPLILFVFFAGGTLPALGLLVWWVLLAIIFVDNILGPLLTSKGTQLHPLLVLLAALGGFTFFGPAGVLLGPLSLSLFFTLLSISRKV